MDSVKNALLGLLGGLITGAAILGLGGRIVMSLIALLGDATPSWSLGGSIDVIVFGAMAGAVVGVIYAVIAPRLPGTPLVKGLVGGLLLIGVMALVPLPSSRSAMAGFDHLRLPALLLFGVICLIFGTVLAVTQDAWARRLVAKNK